MPKSLYFKLGSHFLDLEDLVFVEEQLKKFPLESITIGDAGEINNCQVGRLMEDQPQSVPKILNNSLSKPILDLYSTARANSFFAPFLHHPSPQFIRRSQFNLLGSGSYVGRHLDIDSNPDYQVAAVLQLGSSFRGGEFVVYPSSSDSFSEPQSISPEYGSLTISFCSSEHEVKPVLSGTRTSLVMFISNDSSINQRKV